MNIFAGLTQYAQKWSLKDSRDFTEEEINAVEHAEVTKSEYGKSVCFFMNGGGQTFIPLSSDCSLGVGEPVDLTKAKILTLSRQGDADIHRISI